jgi:hypothetical protein
MSEPSRTNRAVLVLPDVGLSERQLDEVKEEFQNHLVGTLRSRLSRDDIIIVVVVVVVYRD